MNISEISANNKIAWSTVLEVVLKDLNCVTGTIHQLGDDGLLHMIAGEGIPEHVLPMVKDIPIGKGIAGVAAEKLEPVEICNLQQDDGGGVAKASAKDTKVSGSIAVPVLTDQGELCGTLGVGMLEEHAFTTEEKQKLAEHAKGIAVHLVTK